jgi:hypothetical protein
VLLAVFLLLLASGCSLLVWRLPKRLNTCAEMNLF